MRACGFDQAHEPLLMLSVAYVKRHCGAVVSVGAACPSPIVDGARIWCLGAKQDLLAQIRQHGSPGSCTFPFLNVVRGEDVASCSSMVVLGICDSWCIGAGQLLKYM